MRKSFLKSLLFLFIFLTFSTINSFSQPGFEDDEQPIIPISGGAGILLASGFLIAFAAWYKYKKSN